MKTQIPIEQDRWRHSQIAENVASLRANIGVGITAGFVLHPLFKLATGRAREVRPGLWALFVLSLCFFIFYPYR